jgi:hypothetical protein
MKFVVNFLVDDEEEVQGCWVVHSESPRDIIEAAWGEIPPQAMYPIGWLVHPYSHAELDTALQFFWEIVRELELEVIKGKILEKLWHERGPI